MNKKTKLILILSISALLVAATVFTLWFVFLRAPKVVDVYDRVVELVETSHEVNNLFYGSGLPVYRTDSVYAELTQMYYGFNNKDTYEIVDHRSKYVSSAQIKDAAEQVYSKEYLEKVLYPSAFDGYVIGTQGGSAISRAKYLEDEEWIYQLIGDKNYLKGKRIYDYSTMKIAYPSGSKAFYVTMDSWMEHSPEKVEEIRLRIVLQDGQWYLDSFTG